MEGLVAKVLGKYFEVRAVNGHPQVLDGGGRESPAADGHRLLLLRGKDARSAGH